MSLEQPAPLIDVHEYLAMAERGEIAPDARVELLEGQIVDMAPAGDGHFSSTSRLLVILAQAVGTRAFPICQQPIRLTNLSEPEPDLALLRARPQGYSTKPHAEDVLLVVEVSDSTLAQDRNLKQRLYARAGIPEYWIVNLVERVVEIHTLPDPAAGRYRMQQVAKRGQTVSCLAMPDLNIAVADFMP